MKPIKITVDVLLLISFIVLMFFRATGSQIHIISGILMIVLVWLHVILNRKQIVIGIKKRVTKNEYAIKAIAIFAILLFGALTTISIVDVLPKLVGNHDITQKDGETVQDGEKHEPKPGESKNSDQSLDELRSEIDTIDDEIMQALAHRFSVTNEIGTLKQQQKTDVLDTTREAKVYERLEKLSAEYNLPQGLERELWNIIMGYSKAQQTQHPQ